MNWIRFLKWFLPVVVMTAFGLLFHATYTIAHLVTRSHDFALGFGILITVWAALDLWKEWRNRS